MAGWASIRNNITYMKIQAMALRYLYIGLIGLFSFAAHAQTSDTAFSRQWALIDSLILKNDLTRTAITRTNELYREANRRKLYDQAVKALIYRYSLEDRIMSEDPAHSIRTMQAEIDISTDAAQKAVLYSLLAKQYLQYFNQHRWQLYNRTNTSGYKKTDISTWSPDDFTKAITAYFLLSLKDKKLLQAKLHEFYALNIGKVEE